MIKEKIDNIVDEFRVVDKILVSSYKDGYIGKNVYKVKLANGCVKNIEQILKNSRDGDAVVMIPVTENGNILMLVQSRPNTKETVCIELPAGMVDEEDFKTAAVRELLEETGYFASDIYELEWHYQDQGCSSAVIKTFVMNGCKKIQEKVLDSDENIEYIEMTMEEVLSLVKDNIINDANTKIAIMNYCLKNIGIL